jgi:RNA polymerase sigma-54 factor
MLNQKLQQKMLQKLSPQQIQLMKLLQVPTVALEQRIKQEMEENPALEDAADEEVQDEESQTRDEDDDNQENEEENEIQDDEFDLQEYIDDDYIPDYKTKANNTSPDDEADRREIPFVSSLSFHDSLISQLSLRNYTGQQYEIGLYIIGNIDESGYLKREVDAMVDDLAFSQNIQTSASEVLEVVHLIQELDPPGVGARDLQECLLIQLKRNEEQTGEVKNATVIIEKYFGEFIKKHYDKITKRMGISDEELKAAYNEILKLNPKPGNSVIETTKTAHYIVPDFIINNTEGQLELTLNSRNAPDLRINRSYSEMIETMAASKKKLSMTEKDLLVFIKQKIDSARWFIDMIKQRQNTLYGTMKAIMDYQADYFSTGDETRLRPMILKDIAEIVSLDISTISRVANSKYVQTPYGTFLLKSFFSESMQTESGEEVSTREVKKILSDCVEAEDKSKPVTDEALMKILKDKGYTIARRTVAKYREQLGIPVARLRKEL